MTEIIEHEFKWSGTLKALSEVRYIVLHHTASETADVQGIHKLHLGNGWSGIGYHLLVRKDGTVHRGRPLDKQGAHAEGRNYCSVGICFEGNFENGQMGEKQVQAGVWAVLYLRGLFPKAEVLGHKALCATACPGRFFPMERIGGVMTGKEIYEALSDYLEKQELPEWAREDFLRAVSLGITDGTKPMAVVPRYQAAIMAARAVGEDEGK